MGARKITIVDYGLGNLFSVERAVSHIGGEAVITSDAAVIERAERLILPGVGAFAEGMNNIERKGLKEPLLSFAASGRPFLGICLGMQLLMDTSEEMGLCHGLKIMPGKVVRLDKEEGFDPRYKIPHIGWNILNPARRGLSWKGTILENIGEGEYVYFVHSYIAVPDEEEALAVTEYGGRNFCSVAKRNNVYGCQFHPEKSGQIGLKILKDFLEA